MVLEKCYDRLVIFGGLIALLLGSWALAKPISQLENPSEGWWGWLIVWVTALIVFRNSAYAQWMQGMNQVAQLRRVEAFLVTGATAVTSIVLIATHDFIWSVAAAALGAITSSYAIRCLGGQQPNDQDTHKSSQAVNAVYTFVWPAAWRSGVGILSCGALIQVLGLLYAQFATAAQAASYLLAMRVMQALQQASVAPFYSKIPLFASLYGSERRLELVAAVRSAAAKSYALFAASVIMCGILAEPFMRLVGSQINFVSSQLWFLLALAFFIERFGAIHIQFYSLSNKILWHILNGAAGVSILVLILILFPRYGIYAMPLAMIVSYVCFYASIAAINSYRHYELNAFAFELKSSVIPAFLLLVAFVIVWILK